MAYEADRMEGVVTQVMLTKGFAFVRGLEDGFSRFVYVKDVTPTADFERLHEGAKVSFVPRGTLDLTPGAKNNGLKGVQVRLCQ